MWTFVDIFFIFTAFFVHFKGAVYRWRRFIFAFFPTHFQFSACATNTIWPPFFKTSPTAENTASLLPSLSDRPPLSWQHAMAQHLLGFSWMASDCISCLGIRSPLSHKHPTLAENMQHTAVYRAIEVCLCLRLNILCGGVSVCVSLSAAEMLPKGLSHLITASDMPLLLY